MNVVHVQEVEADWISSRSRRSTSVRHVVLNVDWHTIEHLYHATAIDLRLIDVALVSLERTLEVLESSAGSKNHVGRTRRRHSVDLNLEVVKTGKAVRVERTSTIKDLVLPTGL